MTTIRVYAESQQELTEQILKAKDTHLQALEQGRGPDLRYETIGDPSVGNPSVGDSHQARDKTLSADVQIRDFAEEPRNPHLDIAVYSSNEKLKRRIQSQWKEVDGMADGSGVIEASDPLHADAETVAAQAGIDEGDFLTSKEVMVGGSLYFVSRTRSGGVRFRI